MKPCAAIGGLRAHSRMTRSTGIVVLLLLPALLMGQAGGDKALRAQADAQFAKGAYAQAFEAYQTLMGNALEDFSRVFVSVSLQPGPISPTVAKPEFPKVRKNRSILA